MESEINQLKDKLRTAYEEIETLKGPDDSKQKSAVLGILNDIQEGASSKVDTSAIPAQCEQCKNYEFQLVQAQEANHAEKEKQAKLEKTIDSLHDDLEKESKLRLDLEAKWQEKRENHKEEVKKLTDEMEESQQKITEIWAKYEAFKNDVNQELLKLIEERQQVYEHLETLQKDNDYLSGCYLENSQYLKDQDINLPQSIEELHELVLKLHENLIVSKTGCEFNEAKCISFKDESNLLRDQIHQREKERLVIEQKANSRIHNLEYYKMLSKLNFGLIKRFLAGKN